MDWKSHRIEAVLEQALIEDQAVSDATTTVTIDPGLRASASIIARQELVVAGLDYTSAQTPWSYPRERQGTASHFLRRASVEALEREGESELDVTARQTHAALDIAQAGRVDPPAADG